MAKNTCASCKSPEAPDRKGHPYSVKAESGKALKMWLCNRCAVTLGPQQGPITLQDPKTKV